MLPALCLLALRALLLAAEPELERPASPVFTWGGALRWRYEYNNRNGTFDGARGVEDAAGGFLRIRTRIWGEARHDRFTFHLQLGNEFRHYLFREDQKGKRRFPDQLYIDQLWVRYEEIAGWLDLKIGRQRLNDVASNRIICEGTPVDGSRSDFFDAIRATVNFDERKQRQLEVIGLMVAHHDWLPTLGHQHPPRASGRRAFPYDYSGSNHRELGLMLYWRDRSNPELPWELYAIWKQEDGRYSTALALERSHPRQFNTYTTGFRLLPKFSDRLSGELEMALQLGDDHLLAAMGYGALSYAFPDTFASPLLKLGLYGLSGDAQGTRGNHAWHALFNRSATLGDVVSSLYPNLDHNNLLYPHAALSIALAEGTHTASLECGPLFAPARESDRYGHSGPTRGLLLQFAWETDVAKLLDDRRFAGLTFAAYAALLRMGNYFPEEARGDLSSAFLVEFRYTF